MLGLMSNLPPYSITVSMKLRGVARIKGMWVTKMTDNSGSHWVTQFILKILGVSG